jgi:hypothetical protein
VSSRPPRGGGRCGGRCGRTPKVRRVGAAVHLGARALYNRGLLLEEVADARKVARRPVVLVALPAGDLVAVRVDRRRLLEVVGPAKLEDPLLPVPLLANQLVDVVVEVADLELAEARVLDLRDLPRRRGSARCAEKTACAGVGSVAWQRDARSGAGRIRPWRFPS